MSFLTLAKSRFSVRKYKTQEVEQNKVLKILEAARCAPSAVNFQPWHFIVINDKSKLKEIYQAYNREWIKEAPLIIVACADHSNSWKRKADDKDSADMDVAIAVDHMTLMANELDLGTCWVCNFDVALCKQALQLPEHIEPLVILPIGYANVEVPVKKRKALHEITHLNTFGSAFS